jgi:hypothetical protein
MRSNCCNHPGNGMSHELTTFYISPMSILKSGEILLFLNDPLCEVNLNLVTLVLGKIDPKTTAVLRYSLSEFYCCQLADLGNFQSLDFALADTEQGDSTHRLVRRVGNYLRESRYASRRGVKIFVECCSGLYMNVRIAAEIFHRR